MAETTADDPIALAEKQHQDSVINTLESVGRLAEFAIDMGRWAPYVDWSVRLAEEGTLKSPELIDAFQRVRRYDFLPKPSKPAAGLDRPLGIGHGQTNSQPSTVAKMLEWLDIQPGQKVLEVGAGSGWATALMADVVGPEGVVHGTERITELVRSAQGNLAGYSHLKAVMHRTPRRLGLASEAPYDRILVSASAPEAWAMELFNRQLSENGGIIVVPIAEDGTQGNSRYDKKVVALQKNDNGTMEELRGHEGYAFVPLVLPEQAPAKVA